MRKWENYNSNDEYHRINVEADWSELSDDYGSIVVEYAKITIPGFRPGKVTRNIIRAVRVASPRLHQRNKQRSKTMKMQTKTILVMV